MAQQRKHRAGRTIEGSGVFLLRLARDKFFVRFDGAGSPLGCAIPSVAWHGSYEEADDLCQKFKSLGYACVVCDRFGRMADVATLTIALRENEQQMARFWGVGA